MKAAVNTWRRFWRLDATERGIVLEAAAALAATWAGLRLSNFRGWKSVLGLFVPQADSRSSALPADLLATARIIAQMESSAARHLFFTPNCLERSLVLWWLLRRRRIPVELRIGGRKESGRFEAHAWVEVAGAIFDDAAGEHRGFAPFDARSIEAESR
ncbi:MAG: lasso peptide biosynthesis B2 protein [Candidatus Acidiferrales bacterium]